MPKPNYSIELLEFVVSLCTYDQLLLVSEALKDELDYYPVKERKQLFHVVNERFATLSHDGRKDADTTTNQTYR